MISTFVTANNIEDDKLVPTLLTMVGSDHYSLLRRLVSPQLPKEKSFDDLVATLKKHYDPEPIVISTKGTRAQANQSVIIWQTSGASPAVANLVHSSKKLLETAWYVACKAKALRRCCSLKLISH